MLQTGRSDLGTHLHRDNTFEVAFGIPSRVSPSLAVEMEIETVLLPPTPTPKPDEQWKELDGVLEESRHIHKPEFDLSNITYVTG